MTTAAVLDPFANISRSKSLPIYKGKDHELDFKKLADYLNFSNQDIAKASDVSATSVRFDANRMPEKMKIRLREIANICELVAEHFNGDPSKTALWFNSKNPMLGGITPRDMLRFGRYSKLVQIIMDFKNGNLA